MLPILKSKKPFLQKRKKENVRNVSKSQKQNNKKKKHLPTRNVAHSKKPFLQKRKKENVRNVPKSQKQNNKKQTILTYPECCPFESPRTRFYKKKRTLLETFLAKSFPSNSPTQEFLQKKKN